MTGEGVACRLSPSVIASAAKQSILSCGKMDCFAALAMTAGAMDCFAEPDRARTRAIAPLAMTARAMDCVAEPVIGPRECA
jgi:hypothetical protein